MPDYDTMETYDMVVDDLTEELETAEKERDIYRQAIIDFLACNVYEPNISILIDALGKKRLDT